MQTTYGPSSTNVSPHTRKIALITILLFALSGLISGFAVGAFVRPKFGVTTNTGSATTPIVHKNQTSGPTGAPENVWLGEPQITDFTYIEKANGSTSYTLSTLVVDKSNQPIQASDVTCKLVLTKDGNAMNAALGEDNYAIPRAINTIQNPFPGEITGQLNFNAPSQQIQPCTPGGKTTWNYTISSSIEPGLYYLLVFADWKGKHYNWRWQAIRIRKAN